MPPEIGGIFVLQGCGAAWNESLQDRGEVDGLMTIKRGKENNLG